MRLETKGCIGLQARIQDTGIWVGHYLWRTKVFDFWCNIWQKRFAYFAIYLHRGPMGVSVHSLHCYAAHRIYYTWLELQSSPLVSAAPVEAPASTAGSRAARPRGSRRSRARAGAARGRRRRWSDVAGPRPPAAGVLEASHQVSRLGCRRDRICEQRHYFGTRMKQCFSRVPLRHVR